MKLKVDIDTDTFVRFFAVAAAFVLGAILLMHLSGPLTLIFVSFFLAIALSPPVNKLTTLLPGHSRVWATALSYLLVIGALGGFIVIAVPPAVSQTVAFAQEVPGYVDNLQHVQGPIRSFLRENNLETQYNTSVQNIQQQITGAASSVGTAFVSGVGALLNGFVTLLTVLVLTFLMIVEGPRWINKIWSFYRDDSKRELHQDLANKMYRVVTSYVNGQVLVASIASASSLAVLLLLSGFLNVPLMAILPLAGVILITSMIPMIGATIGAVIVAIALFVNDVTAAIIFTVYFFIYQQVENNVVQPAVQSRSVELSALSVIVAVTIGVGLFGILGALVSIPVAGCIRVLVKAFIEHRQREAAHHQPKNMIHKVKKAFKSEQV